MMRPENSRMQAFLASHGIKANVKYLATGSLKHTWRLYDKDTKWTVELAEKLTNLGFKNFDGGNFDQYSGNGGMFSVFARGHLEFIIDPDVKIDLKSNIYDI